MKKPDLDVYWFLPGAKRRFATSTKADSDMMGYLAEDGLTIRQARAAIPYPSEEITLILDTFEAKGFGDTLLSDLGIRY